MPGSARKAKEWPTVPGRLGDAFVPRRTGRRGPGRAGVGWQSETGNGAHNASGG